MMRTRLKLLCISINLKQLGLPLFISDKLKLVHFQRVGNDATSIWLPILVTNVNVSYLFTLPFLDLLPVDVLNLIKNQCGP